MKSIRLFTLILFASALCLHAEATEGAAPQKRGANKAMVIVVDAKNAAEDKSAKESDPAAELRAKIIPAPVNMSTGPGGYILRTNFIIAASTVEAQRVAKFLADRLSQTTDLSPVVAEKGAGISLRIADISTGPEGYTLTANADEIEIVGQSARGLSWGVESLLQLLPPEVYGDKRIKNADWKVPCLSLIHI